MTKNFRLFRVSVQINLSSGNIVEVAFAWHCRLKDRWEMMSLLHGNEMTWNETATWLFWPLETGHENHTPISPWDLGSRLPKCSCKKTLKRRYCGVILGCNSWSLQKQMLSAHPSRLFLLIWPITLQLLLCRRRNSFEADLTLSFFASSSIVKTVFMWCKVLYS